MSDINIILTNMPNSVDEPTSLKIGTISEQDEKEFLARLTEYTPKENDENSYTCGFYVHYASNTIRVAPCNKTKEWEPLKQINKANELVIEMIPLSRFKCGVFSNYDCPNCLRRGNCASPFIKKYIGSFLFPNKYPNQK